MVEAGLGDARAVVGLAPAGEGDQQHPFVAGIAAQALAANEAKIVEELIAVQGKPVDIGGYYKPDMGKLAAAMRPSATLNAALAAL